MTTARSRTRSGWRSGGVAGLAWRVLARFGNGGGRLAGLVEDRGIVVFVGPNGSGKSLLAVETMLPTLAGQGWDCADLEHLHNRPLRAHFDACAACVQEPHTPLVETLCGEGVALLARHGSGVRLAWSTLPLLDPASGQPHELFRPLTSVRDLVAIEHADVLFDEVAGVSDASDSSTMPAGLTRWLQQLRKRDVRLRVTTPAYDRCSKPIRQVATLVVDVRSFAPESPTEGARWRPRRAMIAKGYDAFEFGTFNKNSGTTLKAMASWFYWRADHQGQHHYSTLAQVHALVDVTETGVCTTCNGSRSRAACECPAGVHDLPADEVVIEERTTTAGKRYRRAVPLTLDDDTPGPVLAPVPGR